MHAHRNLKTFGIGAVLLAFVLLIFGCGIFLANSKNVQNNLVEAAGTSVALPSLDATYFDDDGATHTPSITYDSSKVQIVTAESTLSASTAGEYKIVFELLDPVNTEWANGHNRQIALAWRI